MGPQRRQFACTDVTEGLRKKRSSSSRDADLVATSGFSLIPLWSCSEILAPLVPCHTQWGHRKDKSTGLADTGAVLSCAAAMVPPKQSNTVLSQILSRERHLMNPHWPLYKSGSAGQGTRF